MDNDFLIRNERQEEYRQVENLVRESFWNIYTPGCTEHYVLHCYRDNPDFIPQLDFVMEKEGKLIGQVIFSKAELILQDGTSLPSCECNLPARDGEPSVGYWIAKPYWNRGICTEALGLMIEHIRRMTGIKSIISGHFVDNPASGTVMEKNGFLPTGQTVIDENLHQGNGRPIRVMRLEVR